MMRAWIARPAVGTLSGRTKIASSPSPLKNVEVFVVGISSATLIGAALWRITPFDPVPAGLLACFIGLIGVFGGLVMSALKPDRGVKEWDNRIEGQGGLIGRLDSVVFSAPVLLSLVRFWWSFS